MENKRRDNEQLKTMADSSCNLFNFYSKDTNYIAKFKVTSRFVGDTQWPFDLFSSITFFLIAQHIFWLQFVKQLLNNLMVFAWNDIQGCKTSLHYYFFFKSLRCVWKCPVSAKELVTFHAYYHSQIVVQYCKNEKGKARSINPNLRHYSSFYTTK